MLVPFRHPVGIAVSALALLSFLGFVLGSVYGEPTGVRGRDRKVERILATSATRRRFVIETMSAPAGDGWYRLEVDRRSRRVSATCGGSPAPGCVNGHWRYQDRGLPRSYLLGD